MLEPAGAPPAPTAAAPPRCPASPQGQRGCRDNGGGGGGRQPALLALRGGRAALGGSGEGGAGEGVWWGQAGCPAGRALLPSGSGVSEPVGNCLPASPSPCPAQPTTSTQPALPDGPLRAGPPHGHGTPHPLPVRETEPAAPALPLPCCGPAAGRCGRGRACQACDVTAALRPLACLTHPATHPLTLPACRPAPAPAPAPLADRSAIDTVPRANAVEYYWQRATGEPAVRCCWARGLLCLLPQSERCVHAPLPPAPTCPSPWPKQPSALLFRHPHAPRQMEGSSSARPPASPTRPTATRTRPARGRSAWMAGLGRAERRAAGCLPRAPRHLPP